MISNAVRKGCVELPTGAWYDPATPGGMDLAGNPNVLTLDKGTSSLGQGCAAHTTLVEIEKCDGAQQATRAYEEPEIVAREAAE